MARSQATALETYDSRTATVANQNNNQQPENDGPASCTIICLKIAEKFLELQPESDEEIAGTLTFTILSTFR